MVDDTGTTLATARYLEIFANNAAAGEGVIERTDDADAFQFTTTGGAVSLRVNPVGDWANLADAGGRDRHGHCEQQRAERRLLGPVTVQTAEIISAN